MKNFNQKSINISEEGFTLVELLVTISIAAVIAGTILIFFNPVQQYARARNNQRTTHVNIIASAVRARITDNHGVFETNCSSGSLPTTSTQMGSGEGNYNIEPCIVPVYLSVMPVDPVNGTTTATGYNIAYSTTTRQFTVRAPNAELNQVIFVTR